MRRLYVCVCLAAVIFFYAASDRAEPPAKALRFGKLVDGKGKVWTERL
jgi:hypothetical protein